MEIQEIKEKFTKVYNKESDALFRYCLIRVHDREKAMDIVQDIFTELWKKYNSGEDIKSDRAYLFTLAHNRIIDWYRKKKSESLDELLEENDESRPFDYADEHAYSGIMISAETKRFLAAIEKLEPTYRDVLQLRFIKDLSPQEIASILGSTANVISVRITRGLEKLRKQFHE